MRDSLVLELQDLAQTGSTPLSELLRRAKVVAVKLSIHEAATWIDHEIDGYPPHEDVPEYRVVPCELRGRNRFHGWQAVPWEEANPIQEAFSRQPQRRPIAEIEVFAQGGDSKQASLTQEERDLLVNFGNAHLLEIPLARFYARHSFVAILDGVRKKILDWSLALEQRDVLGRGMTFNEAEKRAAASLPFRIGEATTVVLFLSANPDAKSPLQVEKEQNRIVKVRNGSRHQDKVRIEGLPDTDLLEFTKSLRLHAPLIVHFAGHGDVDGSLLMRDENQKKYNMRPEGVAKLVLLEKATVRLVVLNACYSSALADLLVAEIDCVVGMSAAVSDVAAILFSQTFYGTLFDGDTVARAFSAGEAAVRARYPDEAGVPVLKARRGFDPASFRIV